MDSPPDDAYRKLQRHLDDLPIGFPATESGVELRLLQHLFTPEEAELATHLSFVPEPVKTIYRRVRKTGITPEELEEKLDALVAKGALNGGAHPKTGKKYYANAFFAVGMFEYQVGRLTPEFVEDMHAYMDEAFIKEFTRTKIPQLRTIPLEQSLTPEHEIASYDQLAHFIENARGKISVANCICRQIKDMEGTPCKATDMRELCFQFRGAAEYYIENGLGREVTKEEALSIARRAEDDGLVLQPGNTVWPYCLCCCCGCCCEILTNVKKFPRPAEFFATNHHAAVLVEECVGCGTCLERCPMDALALDESGEDPVCHVNRDRCIGCGACVTACPTEALRLEQNAEVVVPPHSTTELYTKIMREKAAQVRDAKSETTRS